MAKSGTKNSTSMIPDEVVISKIYLIREQKVMLDNDLAELYGVETRRLKEQVRRNLVRFPPHFMFELSREEYQEILRSQNATLEQGAYSKYLPFAFTEHGLLMLSNVLKSERAISMSIRIIDVFVKMREKLASHTELYLEIERIKNEITKQIKRQDNQDKNIELVFQYLDELADKKNTIAPQSERKRIGYVLGKENQN
uniref:KilA-N, DNA-binding domain n=1 Tax=Sphingobacterium sp. (strain 21) TaxID=743722 RepID=F4C9T6_SPHS2